MKYTALLLTVIGLAAGSALSPTGHNNQNHNRSNSSSQNNNLYYNSRNRFGSNTNGRLGNQEFATKQQFVLQLLTNLQQDNPFRYQAQKGNNFNPFESVQRFHNQPAVARFLKNYVNNDFLPQDEVFSPSIQQHHNQAAQLFNFFYSARDWNTFYQAAAWARDRFNPQQFAYAFTAAVLNHPETQGVFIPALYEIFPHAFVPATALQKIYYAKFQGYQHATVYANYTSQNQNNKNYVNYYNNKYNNNYNNDNNNHFSNNNPHNPNSVFAENDGSPYNNAGVPENPENRLNYFTEDIGINAFHAAFHARNPSFFGSNYNNNYWVSNNNNGNNDKNYRNQEDLQRGEEFYYAHQQLYARYVLERLSNNLPIPKPINFRKAIKPGFNPRLQYANGEAVPARPPYTQFLQLYNNDNTNTDNAQLPNNNQAQNPTVYEQRLQAVADSGFVINEDGSKTQLSSKNGVAVLANLAAAPGRSANPSYYGNYFSTATNAIGNIVDPNNQNGVAPGAVSNYATAARDPAYYKFLAKFLQIFNNFQNNQGPYAQAELAFPGVKIQSFDVSKLTTYFETFSVNVNNAVNEDPANINNNYNNVNSKTNIENTEAVDSIGNNHRYRNNNRHYNSNRNNNYNNDYNNNNNYNDYNNNDSNNDYSNSNDYNDYNSNNRNNNNNANRNANYRVKFQRLTNKPYNYKLVVESNKNINAVVRVFIGPKFDSNGQEFTLPQASQYFVQLDQFPVQLHNGQNNIQRNSQQSPNFVQDSPSFQQLWNVVQRAKQGEHAFRVNNYVSRHFRIPQRVQLPKGKVSGQQFVFYAIVTEASGNGNNYNSNDYNNNNNDYNNYNNGNDYNNNNNNYNDYDSQNNNNDYENNNFNYNNSNYDNFYKYYGSQDNRSIGFPFDRPVQDVNYNTGNQIFKTVTVYHKNHRYSS